MEKHILSKSTFIRGNQCLKSLYLNKKRPFLRDRLSDEQKAKFKRGSNVGVLAQDLFPGGINVKPKSPAQYQKSVMKTRELIQEGCQTIYEATFQYDGVLIMLDVLHCIGGKWHAFEVKSSLKLTETYILDAAVQYYVMKGSGIEPEDISIIYMNKDYERAAALSLQNLFLFRSVKEEVAHLQNHVQELIQKEKETIALKSSPKIDVGPQCLKPYPCDFYGHCHKKMPQNGIHTFYMDEEDKWSLINQGLKNIDDYSTAKASGIKNKTKVLLDALKEQSFFMSDDMKREIEGTGTNTILLKVLFYRPAIPPYQGTKPYQQIPIACAYQKGGKTGAAFFPPNQNPLPGLQSILKSILADKPLIITDYKLPEYIFEDKTQIPQQMALLDFIVEGKYYEAKIAQNKSSDAIFKILLNIGGDSKTIKSEVILQEEFKYKLNSEMELSVFEDSCSQFLDNRLKDINLLYKYMREKTST